MSEGLGVAVGGNPPGADVAALARSLLTWDSAMSAVLRLRP